MTETEKSLDATAIDFSFRASGVIDVISFGLPVKQEHKGVLTRAQNFLLSAIKGEKAVSEIEKKGFDLTEVNDVRMFKWALRGFDAKELEVIENMGGSKLRRALNEIQITLKKLIDNNDVKQDKVKKVINFFELIHDSAMSMNVRPVDIFEVIPKKS